MTNEEFKVQFSTLLPSCTIDESGEFLTVLISSEELLPFMNTLRTKSDLDFDYLFCLTCIDWKDHLMMVYHLYSKTLKHCVVVKARIDDIENPKIESLNSIWKTAEMNENEVFDLFGVQFTNHPNLRRLFMEANWKGFPLRKNYEDENMIKL